MKKNERLHALQLLIELLDNGTSLSHLLASDQISPLTKDICFGVCRYYYRLAAIADSLLKKRPKTTDIWTILLIGLYQLHYLRIPDYAVVKETVTLLVQIKKPWAKGLVNAILRTYCREQLAILERLEHQPDFKYNHPAWLIAQLQKAWPTDWASILLANDVHPPMSLRVNAQRTSVETYLLHLQKVGIEAQPHPYSSQGMIVTKPCSVHDLPGFETGDVSVQDVAAQLAVSCLQLKPGLRLLDACAAPGGKTCHILEAEPELAACVALDLDSKRLIKISENLSRLKLTATVLQGDAQYPSTWWDGQPFDRILLDAPCSATGVIRRHSDIKLLRKKNDIPPLVHLQQALLNALWPLLAPGGIMVYATCSVLPEENELQIRRFIEIQSDGQIFTPKTTWGHPTGHGLQIFPGDSNMDGFFYSVLMKKTAPL